MSANTVTSLRVVLHDRASLFIDHVRVFAQHGGPPTAGVFWNFRRFANQRGEWSKWDIQQTYQHLDDWPFEETPEYVTETLQGWVTGMLEVVSQTGEKLPNETGLELRVSEEHR